MPQSNSFFLLLGRFRSRRGFAKFFGEITFILLSCAIFILDFFEVSYISDLKNRLSEFAIPVKVFANRLIEIQKDFHRYIDFKKENEKLRLELDKLKLKVIITHGTESELNELRKLVNLKYQSDSFEFMEKVLGFDDSIFNSFLLISKTHDSTKENSVVISQDGLVGFVSNVHKNFAKVLLLTASNAFIPVKNDSGEHLILKGTGKNELISTEIKSSTTKYLKVGEILYTSGEGGIFKTGIPVAKIIKIDKNQTRIYAKPIADLNTLNYIWTIKPLD